MISYEDFLQRVQRMDNLVRDLEAAADPTAAAARELAQTIVELHGAGLARMLAIVGHAGDQSQRLLDELMQDDLVRSLLLLHELHPLDLDTRVRLVVDKVQPLARGYGASLELVSIGPDAVRLRIDGCDDGSSAWKTLQHALEDAILEAAPDAPRIVCRDAAATDVHGFSLPIITLPLVRA